MAKLVYSVITSLDEYVEGAEGKFERPSTDDEVHAFVKDLEQPIGTYLHRRKMHETMFSCGT